MKFELEHLALWEERYLLTEQGEESRGFIGWQKGVFTDGQTCVSGMTDVSRTLWYELEALVLFLKGESAGYVLRTHADMTAFCRDKLHDHVPYAFNRECWGFRVLTEEYAWYLALTPWNEKRPFTIYCYDRKALMTALANAKGLPESCYGVLKYTGERILIRYGAASFESFPQYGGHMVENRRYADEQNEALNLTVEQVSAMENGVIYGWDTPMANIQNYDEEGHYVPPVLIESRENRGR